MDFRLDIFPQGSLASSVITTVWVGVWVVAFFNLRLGWTFSGLVIPGYLVPLLLVKPFSALTLCVEGVVTYLVVRLISDWNPLPSWASMFGRDRYFSLLVVSVPVRMFFDGWLLLHVGEWVNETYGIEFDYHNNLLGFGLVIIPLIANQFWKTGLSTGVPYTVIPVAITYLLVRFVLIEFTNFSVGNLQYVYEEIAADLLAGPKAYIITLITAFLASRMNQRYAWEYHGIHIPALLAIEWYEPIKILSTCVEAAVIYALASVALKLPIVRTMSFEGAQKMLFFFNIGFLYKLVLGYLAVEYAPEVKVTDYFGFGYMISTLIAVKAHDKDIPMRVTRAILQMSLVGALIAGVIGFGLTYIPRAWLSTTPASIARPAPPREQRLIEILRENKLGLYGKSPPVRPDSMQRETFGRALRAILAHAKDRDAGELERARELLGEVNYDLYELPQGNLYLRERLPTRGWGMYVFNLDRLSGPVVEVPLPLDEWATLEAGAFLFERWAGGALAIGGGGRTHKTPGIPVTEDPQSFFHVFHSVMGRHAVVQIRGYTEANVRQLTGIRPMAGDLEPPEAPSAVWFTSAIPTGVSLGDLRELLGPFDVNWAPAPVQNIQRDSSKGQVAEVFLSRTHRRALLARTLLAQDAKAPAAKLLEAKGNLRDWLLRQRQEFASAGSELYVPAVEAEMLYFDEEVLTPIVRAIQSRGLGAKWSDVQQSRLQAAAAAAAVFRYGVTIYQDTSSSSEFVVLSEVEANPRRRYWGTYVFRVGDSKPYVVQVPWPLIEANSFEFGVSLFDRQQAAAFLSVGAHPSANRNFSADVSRIQNRVNLFNLVGQVILREGGPEPLVVVQARAFGLQPNGKMPAADIVLASDNGACDRAGLSSLGKDLLQTLQEDRLTVRFADGSLETAGYRVGATVQAGYLTQAKNKEFVILWVSPQARIRYRQQIENQLQAGHFTALKIQTLEKPLYGYLEALGPRGGLVVVDGKIRALIERYADTQDLVALHTACSLGKAFRFERVIDSDSQQSFLLIHGSDKQFPLVANVGIRPGAEAVLSKSRSVDRERIAEFIRTRATWLEIGGEP